MAGEEARYDDISHFMLYCIAPGTENVTLRDIEGKGLVDLAVYKQVQLFRMIGQTKLGRCRPLFPVNTTNGLVMDIRTLTSDILFRTWMIEYCIKFKEIVHDGIEYVYTLGNDIGFHSGIFMRCGVL